MASALGTLTLLSSEQTEHGRGVWVDLATLVGDADYGAAGTAGLLAALRAAHKAPGLEILSVRDVVGAAATLHLEYDVATDKVHTYALAALAADDHTESTPGDDTSGQTFTLLIVSK